MTSFIKKKIDVIMQLAGNKTFNNMGDNTVTLTGLRVETQLSQVGGIGQGSKATIKIYGMTQSDMNKLSVIALGNGQNVYTNQNRITILAGTDGDMTKVYEGCIMSAWADYSSLPDVPFIISAVPLVAEQNKPAKAHSWQKGYDLATALSELAGEMGISFYNVNVHKQMENTTLQGDLVSQADTLVKTYGIYSQIEFNMMTIAEYGTPVDQTIIEINPDSGLIGVPSVSSKGVSITTLFNPNYKAQGTVNLKSLLSQTDGKWRIVTVSHTLESEKPNGSWFTTMSLVSYGGTLNQSQANAQDGTQTTSTDNGNTTATYTVSDTSGENNANTTPTV